MSIKGCIFDLDGVICETSHLHFIAWQEMAVHLGVDFDHNDNRHLKGVSRRGSLQYILDKGRIDLSSDRFEKLMNLKNQRYLELINDLGPKDLLDGVLLFLKDLQKNNVRIALGSSSKNARRVLKSLGVYEFFDAIVDGNDVVNSKPDPEVFIKGAKSIDCSPAECVVIEDAVSGLRAASEGGFKTIGVGDSDLQPYADVVLSDMKDLSFARLMELISSIYE